MASEAQKVARKRNWQIYMFRGMAYRICQLTRNLSDNKLSTKDKITIVKFNEIMHKQIDYLDSIKKHRHSYGLVFSLGKDICSECGKIKYSRSNQRQCF